jgi:histone H3/H4
MKMSTNGGELLGQGTYGCVFYPALPCNQNKKRPNGVGKIMDLGYGVDDEVEMMNKIALLDPQEKFTIHLTEKCHVNISDIEPTDDPTKKCKVLTGTKNKIVEQLVYKKKGKDLSHYIDRYDFDIYENDILKGFVNLANGLVELQKNKVCHRDIKPANILLTDDGTLVFIDFGMSTEYENVYTKENMSILKYQYVYYPPEFKWIASMEETKNEKGLNHENTENYYNRWKEFVKKTAIVTNKMFQEYQNKNLVLFLNLYDDPKKEMDTQIDASIQKFIDSEVTNHKEDNMRYMYAFCNKIDVFSLGITMLHTFHNSRHDSEDFKEIDNKFKEILKKAVHFNMYERYTPKQLYKELNNFYENTYLKRYPDGLSANNPILIEDDTPTKSASKSETKSVSKSETKSVCKSASKTVSKSVPRERKIKSDISDSALIKLARKAGVVAVSGKVILELKDVIEDRLEIILKKAATLIEYNKKKTFSEKILEQTFDQFNIKMFGAEYEDLKRCKTDKSKPKNVIKTIRFLQKQSDCVYISKSGFKRLVTSILGYFIKDNIKVSEAASLMLQLYFENKTIDLIGNANLVAIHAGRKTLFPIDVRITIKLVKDPLDDFKYKM